MHSCMLFPPLKSFDIFMGKIMLILNDLFNQIDKLRTIDIPFLHVLYTVHFANACLFPL